MSRDGVEEYRGNYSAYVVQRQERWEQRQAQFDSVVEGFLNELNYIKRNIARDSTRDQAVGRMRRLVRQVKAVQIGGIQLLINNKWSVVADQIVIPQTRWNVMELEQNITALPRPANRSHQLNLRWIRIYVAVNSYCVLLNSRSVILAPVYLRLIQLPFIGKSARH